MPAAEIALRYPPASGSAAGGLGLRVENVIGTPVAAAVDLDNGQGIADVYLLAFHVAAGVVTVDVTPATGGKNPNQAAGLAVVADGATANSGILLGVDLIVAATVADGDQAKASIGAYMAAGGATLDRLNCGVVESGVEDPSEVEIAAVNIGDRDAADCSAIALPGSYWTPVAARQFVASIDNHSSTSRERLAVTGSKVITFAGWNPIEKTADVYVGGQIAIDSAKFDGATRYEYGAGNGYIDAADRLRGLAITFQNQATDPTGTTVVLVVDALSYQWVELAPDVSGMAGTWGTAAVALTEDGLAAGMISAAGEAPFWFRWSPPATAGVGDLRLINLRIRGGSI